MSKIKRFIQTALTYLAGNILSKLVTFFLIPLYTNKLTTGDYGDYDVVVTIITLLVMWRIRKINTVLSVSVSRVTG